MKLELDPSSLIPESVLPDSTPCGTFSNVRTTHTRTPLGFLSPGLEHPSVRVSILPSTRFVTKDRLLPFSGPQFSQM